MRFPLFRLLLAVSKTLETERFLITLVKLPAASLFQQFPGVALANFEIKRSAPSGIAETVKQRAISRKQSILWLFHVPMKQTEAVATG